MEQVKEGMIEAVRTGLSAALLRKTGYTWYVEEEVYAWDFRFRCTHSGFHYNSAYISMCSFSMRSIDSWVEDEAENVRYLLTKKGKKYPDMI
jgi:hypothetical protein